MKTYENKKGLALFDFDGTISSKDSLFEFLKYSVGKINFYRKLISIIPVFLKFLFGTYSNSKTKEIVFSTFFYNWPITLFKQIADQYSEKCINKIINKKALDRIHWHKKQNHRIIVVSASIECYLRKWCEDSGLELIGTQLEFQNNRLTGKFLSPNCNGAEKVRRIKKLVNLNEYDPIYAYGNSKGDAPMLKLANHQFYKYFN